MIYLVREVDYDSCSHLALVDGREMTNVEAQDTFRRFYAEFNEAVKVADKAFTDTFGWFDKPLKGLRQEDYHKRRRDELRKAGCWLFTEFLKARGFRPVKYVDVPFGRHDDEDRECIYAQAFSQDNAGIGSCLDLLDPSYADLAKGIYKTKTKLEECCPPCQRRAKVESR